MGIEKLHIQYIMAKKIIKSCKQRVQINYTVYTYFYWVHSNFPPEKIPLENPTEKIPLAKTPKPQNPKTPCFSLNFFDEY